MAPEYDIDPEWDGPDEEYLRRRRLEAEYHRMEMDMRHHERSVVQRIIEMLRGRRITHEAYNIIRHELEHCLDRNDAYFDSAWQRERGMPAWEREKKHRYIMERQLEHMRMRNPEHMYRIIKDDVLLKQEKDFLEEDDMKL